MVLSDIEGTEIELKTNRQEVLKLKKWIVIDWVDKQSSQTHFAYKHINIKFLEIQLILLAHKCLF